MRYTLDSMLPERAFKPRLGRGFGGGGMTLEGGSSGGGGSPAPTQTTVQNTNIPAYAQPYVETMLGAAQQQIFNYDDSGNVTSMKPYTPYSNTATDYIAGFSPLQQQAQSNIANMQVPGAYGAATDFAQTAGLGAMGTANSAAGYGGMGANAGLAGMAQGMSYGRNATDPNAVQAYMNPYLQATLNPAMQLQNQQFGQINAQNQGQATQQGAFGGGRQAVMQGLNQQNQMLAQNQLVGNAYNQAYNTANQNMQAAAGLGMQGTAQAMQGAGLGLQGTAAQQAAYQQLGAQGANLANIAGQQTQTGLAINQAQEAAGAAQQAQQQNIINQQIQNYATAQQYPMMQLANMSNLLRGLPMQSATTQTYQAAPSAVSQLAGLGTTAVAGAKLASMKEGGVAKVKKFDVGGSVKHDLMQMAEADPDAFKEHLKTATSPEEKKIGYQVAVEMGLTGAAPNIRMAGGGIVAFAEGGDADVDEYDDSPYETVEEDQEESENSYNDQLINQLHRMQAAGMTMPMARSYETKTGENKNIRQESRAKGLEGKSFTEKIRHLESRGRSHDEKGNILTSPKGAMGPMQTMPHTLRDPGYGVKPAQNNSVEEMDRVGRDYASAMLARYKNPKLAAMAYNWGTGNVDKYIASGMKGPVPGETRQYAANFAAGGIANVPRFYPGGGPVVDDYGNVATSRAGTPLEGQALETKDEFGNSVKPTAKKSAAPEWKRPSIEDLLKPKMPAGVQNPAGPVAPKAPGGIANKFQSFRAGSNKSGDEYTNIYPASGDAADASYLNQLLMESQKDPSYQPYKDEIASLLKKNPKLADTVATQNKATNQPVIPVPANLNQPAKPVVQPPKDDTPILPPDQDPRFLLGNPPKAPEAPKTDASGNDTAPANDFQKRLMDFIDKKEAGLTTQKQEDKWMSILAAGLGMMGGTSPFAGVNIGKGGQEGVATMLSSNKQRGAEEAALGKLYASGYRANQTDKARNEIGQLNAYNTWQSHIKDAQGKRETLFSNEMKSPANSMVDARIEALGQKLIKNPDDKKAKTEYDSLVQKKEAIRNRIYSSIKDPSAPPGLNLGTASTPIKLD